MSIPSTAALVDTLRHSGLLSAGQLQALGPVAAGADPRGLARLLLAQDWLTPYQVNQLFAGRGSGLVLGAYVLLSRLGAGGMGQVYLARHRHLDRRVALKVLRSDRRQDSAAVSRFRREVLAVGCLTHPNIVQAYDADEIGDLQFLVMEYVDGIDLARLVKERGPLSVSLACAYLGQAARGLQHAFEKGLVHRDIKPSNLLLDRDGTVKLLDLGLALLPPCPEDSLLTHHGVLIGTPDFQAPEQAMDPHRADVRSDLYSLGCTFYFLLTGRPPFPDGAPMEKLFRHKMEEPAPIEQFRSDVSPRVAAVLRRLLAKAPDERLQSPAELVDALAHIDQEGASIPAAARPAPAPEEPASFTLALEELWTTTDLLLRLREEQRRQFGWFLSGLAVLWLFVGMLLLLSLCFGHRGG